MWGFCTYSVWTFFTTNLPKEGMKGYPIFQSVKRFELMLYLELPHQYLQYATDRSK